MQATTQAAARTAIGAGIPFTPASLAQIIGGTDNAAGVTALGLNQAGLTFATNFVGVTKGLLLPTCTDANTGIIKQQGLTYWNTFCPGLANPPQDLPFLLGGNLFIGEGCGNFTLTNYSHANLGIGGLGENHEAAPFSALTSGDENIGIGYGALSGLTSGVQNCIVGNAASPFTTTGSYNTGLGVNIMNGLLDDDNSNTAIGNNCLNTARSTNSAFFGVGAGSGTGTYDTCLGIGAGCASVQSGKTMTNCTFIGNACGGGPAFNVSNVLAIGNFAASYIDASNEFWLDGLARSSLASQKIQSFMTGIFASATSAQWLTINGKLTWRPWASVTPANNGELSVEATSNSLITFKLKGTDGTVRAGTLALV